MAQIRIGRARPETQLLAEIVQAAEAMANIEDAPANGEEVPGPIAQHPVWQKLNLASNAVAAIIQETCREGNPVFTLAGN